MDRPESPRRGFTGDVKCLRCGAMNIPDNQICGRCGANLPLVYDEDGHVVRLAENSFRVNPSARSSSRGSSSVNRTRWMLRFFIVLFALLLGAWILSHK